MFFVRLMRDAHLATLGAFVHYVIPHARITEHYIILAIIAAAFSISYPVVAAKQLF